MSDKVSRPAQAACFSPERRYKTSISNVCSAHTADETVSRLYPAAAAAAAAAAASVLQATISSCSNMKPHCACLLQIVHLMRHGVTEMNVYLSTNRYGSKGFRDPLL
jgi:hypothetical protein